MGVFLKKIDQFISKSMKNSFQTAFLGIIYHYLELTKSRTAFD